MSVTVPSTQQGSPAAPPAMSPPIWICGASATKNGPKTVASVASPVGLVVHRDGLHRHAKDVGEQNELLPGFGGDPADAGEEVDARGPFRLGEPDVPDEGMQVADQRAHHFAVTFAAAAQRSGPPR